MGTPRHQGITPHGFVRVSATVRSCTVFGSRSTDDLPAALSMYRHKAVTQLAFMVMANSNLSSRFLLSHSSHTALTQLSHSSPTEFSHISHKIAYKASDERHARSGPVQRVYVRSQCMRLLGCRPVRKQYTTGAATSTAETEHTLSHADTTAGAMQQACYAC